MAGGVRLRGMQTVWDGERADIFRPPPCSWPMLNAGVDASAGRMPTVWTINYANLRIGFNALPTLRNSNQFGKSTIRFIGIAGIS